MRAPHRSTRALFALSTGLWFSACGGDDGGGGESVTPGDEDAKVRPIEDAGPEPDAVVGGAGGEGGEGGGGAGGETGGSGGAGGEPVVRPVQSCEQACRVFEDCGQIEVWNGMIANCLEACAPVEDDPRTVNFFNCLALASCENVGTCMPPEPPPPNCADVCEAIDACDAEFTLPAGLPNVGECSNACTDATLGPLVTRCGAPILAGTCDPGDFDRCLLSGRYSECFDTCSRLNACGDAGAADVVACTLACDETTRGDALVAHRQAQRNACVARANADCDAIAACGAPAVREIVGEASLEDLCAANADCPLFAAETCVDDARAVLEGLADNSIDCLVDHLTGSCDDGELFRCFRPAGGANADCDDHCLVGTLCNVLPAGQTEGVCVEECNAVVAGQGTPDQQVALEAALLCDEGLTCADVQACRGAGGPADQCDETCARETECGSPEDAGACRARCLDRFASDRSRAERACVAAASTCEQVGLCLPPPPPPCERLCALLDPCDLGGSDCATACDNADLADPSTFLPRVACDASTDRCSARAICEGGDLSGGVACLAWCRTSLECAGGDAAGMLDCVEACGAGLGGAAGLTFDGARACLEAAGADAACAELQACVNDVEPDAFCQGYCEGLDHCLLTEGTVEACVADCQERTLEADYLAEAACTLNAIRRGAGCAAVAECNGVVVEPASPACAAICAAEHACNDAQDVFLCERACVVDPAGDDLRAVCAGLAACERLPECLDAADTAPQGCLDGCGAIAGCDGFTPDAPFPDEAACVADCGGHAVLENPEYPANLAMCLQGAAANACDLPGFASCYLTANVDPICVETYNAMASCGLEGFLGDQAAYYETCMANLEADEAATLASAECIIDTAAMAMGDFLTCGLGILACPPPPSGGFNFPM